MLTTSVVRVAGFPRTCPGEESPALYDESLAVNRRCLRVAMAVVMLVVWAAKLATLLIGLAVVAIGVGMIRFGAPIIASLNKLYARLPGKFRYPPSWHRLVCTLFVLFGLLFAVGGVFFAGR
jgi:hypothetical protein